MGVVTHDCNSSAEETDRWICRAHWFTSMVDLVSSRPVRDPILKT